MSRSGNVLSSSWREHRSVACSVPRARVSMYSLDSSILFCRARGDYHPTTSLMWISARAQPRQSSPTVIPSDSTEICSWVSGRSVITCRYLLAERQPALETMTQRKKLHEPLTVQLSTRPAGLLGSTSVLKTTLTKWKICKVSANSAPVSKTHCFKTALEAKMH